MDDNNFYEELAALQAGLDEQRWEYEDGESHYQALAGIGTIAYGLEQARQLRRKRRYERRLYLTRPELLPDPRGTTSWQALLFSQNDHAFITLMSRRSTSSEIAGSKNVGIHFPYHGPTPPVQGYPDLLVVLSTHLVPSALLYII